MENKFDPWIFEWLEQIPPYCKRCGASLSNEAYDLLLE